MISFSLGESTTISFVIPVICSINFGIGMPGLTKVLYLLEGKPSTKSIAATSMIRSDSKSRPVVSKSSAINLSKLRELSNSIRSIDKLRI